MASLNIWKTNNEKTRLARWEALWAMEDLPRPIWFVPADPMLALPRDYARQKKSVVPLFREKETQLQESVKFNRFYAKLQRFLFKDDYVQHLLPQLGIGVFASAFGCRVDFPHNQYPMTHPLIEPGGNPDVIRQLSVPDVTAGQLGDVLEFVEYFNQQAGDQYPIALTDLQGPLDSAYLIWNACDFMLAMNDRPADVHHLMRMVTDLIIDFIKELRSRVNQFVPASFPPVYLPDGQGITISEDVLAMLSPRYYETFSLPYINQLSEEFGGIIIHSCGNIEHQLDVLSKVHNLRGLNFGVSETRFEAVWEKFGGKIVLIPHVSAASIVAQFHTAYEWVEYVLRIKTTNRGLALMVPPDVTDIHEVEMKLALGEEMGSSGSLLPLLLFGRRMRKLIARYA